MKWIFRPMVDVYVGECGHIIGYNGYPPPKDCPVCVRENQIRRQTRKEVLKEETDVS